MKRNTWFSVLSLSVSILLIGKLLSINTATAGKKNLEHQGVQFISKDSEVLEGLKGVYVLVEPIRENAKKHGLTEVVLKTDVELQLRQNGIPVLTEKEWLSLVNAPYLYIDVQQVFDNSETFAAVSVDVRLEEMVYLLGRPGLIQRKASATTWSEGFILIVGIDRFTSLIRESTRDLVDIFCNHYLAGNPKEKTSEDKIIQK